MKNNAEKFKRFKIQHAKVWIYNVKFFSKIHDGVEMCQEIHRTEK